MDTTTLTTIVLNHLRKLGNDHIKRKEVYGLVSTLYRHHGIKKTKKMIYKQYGIKESDIQMTIKDLPFEKETT